MKIRVRDTKGPKGFFLTRRVFAGQKNGTLL